MYAIGEQIGAGGDCFSQEQVEQVQVEPTQEYLTFQDNLVLLKKLLQELKFSNENQDDWTTDAKILYEDFLVPFQTSVLKTLKPFEESQKKLQDLTAGLEINQIKNLTQMKLLQTLPELNSQNILAVHEKIAEESVHFLSNLSDDLTEYQSLFMMIISNSESEEMTFLLEINAKLKLILKTARNLIATLLADQYLLKNPSKTVTPYKFIFKAAQKKVNKKALGKETPTFKDVFENFGEINKFVQNKEKAF